MIFEEQEKKKKEGASGRFAGVKNWWADQPSKKKRLMIIVLIAAGIIIFATGGYLHRRQANNNATPSATFEKAQEVSLNPNLIEKSMYIEAQESLNSQQKSLANIEEEIAKLKAQSASGAAQSIQQPAISPLDVQTQSGPLPPPMPSAVSSLATQAPAYNLPPPPMVASGQDKKNSPETLGGIEQVVNSTPETPENPDDKKKFQIFLPPSFMEATLLSGVDATTTSQGKNDPVPILIRIKDLAILPNMVKADLKGCFVLGEGKGDLATERVDVRLLTLSCVSRNGEAVIDQAVKGYVVDGDGKAGLRGAVTAKMGALLARSAFAGFLGGVGQAMQMSTQTTQTTALGTQENLWNKTDTDNLIRGGVGGGVSQAGTDLQKFYLQLAQQTLPIIQVGATKTITVVVSDGVNLEVKNESLVK